jgi:hypothetical protein
MTVNVGYAWVEWGDAVQSWQIVRSKDAGFAVGKQAS